MLSKEVWHQPHYQFHSHRLFAMFAFSPDKGCALTACCCAAAYHMSAGTCLSGCGSTMHHLHSPHPYLLIVNLAITITIVLCNHALDVCSVHMESLAIGHTCQFVLSDVAVTVIVKLGKCLLEQVVASAGQATCQTGHIPSAAGHRVCTSGPYLVQLEQAC